jgi:hypothetical protein
LLAQALEHETDHLNGILYIDHLVSRDQLWKVTYTPEGQAEYQQADDSVSSETANNDQTEPSDEKP